MPLERKSLLLGAKKEGGTCILIAIWEVERRG